MIERTSPMDELLRFLSSLGVTPPAGWEERVESLYAKLEEANAEVNLTRITGFEEFLFKHVADSLLVAAAVPDLGTRALDVIDVGCGAGFPGIPVALTFPRVRVTEIDSSRKKIERVERFLGDLGLAGSRALRGRSRELARRRELHGAFDLVLARAVSHTAALVRECRGFLRGAGSAIVAYKTPRLIEEEGPRVLRECAKARLTPRASDVLRLPGGKGERQFWVLERA